MSNISSYNILVEGIGYDILEDEISNIIDIPRENYFEVDDYTQTLRETSCFFRENPELDISSFFKSSFNPDSEYSLISIYNKNFEIELNEEKVKEMAEKIGRYYKTNVYLTKGESGGKIYF